MATKAPHRPIFALIQDLRGIAALWVVLFHLYLYGAITSLAAVLPEPLVRAVFGYGSAGVAVFFVISGFVIAHSLADSDVNARFVARFAARRSIRLDPAYWLSIVVTLAAAGVMAGFHHRPFVLPDMADVLLHLVYLQELARRPEIGVVYWTLTYEIQFYLVLIAACWVRSTLRRREMAGAEAIAFGPLFVLALIAAAQAREWAPHGLFANSWHGFFLGVLAYFAGWRRRSPLPLCLLAAVTLGTGLRSASVFGVPCAFTAMLLFLASRGSLLERGFGSGVLQTLGRISYSLYLLHTPVIALTVGIWARIAGASVAANAIGLVVELGACLLVAHLFWWAVERPTHRLASRAFASRWQDREGVASAGPRPLDAPDRHRDPDPAPAQL